MRGGDEPIQVFYGGKPPGEEVLAPALKDPAEVEGGHMAYLSPDAPLPPVGFKVQLLGC